MKTLLEMFKGIFAVLGLIAVTLIVTAIVVSPDREKTVRAIPGAYWKIVNDTSALALPSDAEPEGKIVTINPDSDADGMQAYGMQPQTGQQGLLQLFGGQQLEDRVKIDVSFSVDLPSEIVSNFLNKVDTSNFKLLVPEPEAAVPQEVQPEEIQALEPTPDEAEMDPFGAPAQTEGPFPHPESDGAESDDPFGPAPQEVQKGGGIF